MQLQLLIQDEVVTEVLGFSGVTQNCSYFALFACSSSIKSSDQF